jgi:hypothetical protein
MAKKSGVRLSEDIIKLIRFEIKEGNAKTIQEYVEKAVEYELRPERREKQMDARFAVLDNMQNAINNQAHRIETLTHCFLRLMREHQDLKNSVKGKRK